ncbi:MULTISPECIES: DNA adenine methylase [unclassified Curtobacterium]|uniref:DNA adenine methylase n=1 Tax=unclassified Curtobacterium TaxID=257496 RepID=UPI001FBB4714|nr:MULTISPECIES: DNA adenine methylase [unclassified Curtobacterium]
MADHVRDAIGDLTHEGRVVDLFSGMGSVAESLQDTASVVTNDALSFTAALSRARFTALQRAADTSATTLRLRPAYERRARELTQKYARQLDAEQSALAGARADLVEYMQRAAHVGNSAQHRRAARSAAIASSSDHYELASLYFSAGYLSLQQAIEVDSIRASIDSDSHLGDRDWLLGAWITATSVLVNAPGHTAQFLRPNSASAHTRIVRTWARSVWEEFIIALDTVALVGTDEWRSKNSVYVGDALDLLSTGQLDDVGTIYADPPYTKDQYSRYYHVYETLYRYDYPDSSGAGRNRSDRFTTGFSLKSAVVASFHDLCRNVARMRVPLVVSYPSSGLLAQLDLTVPDIACRYFSAVDTLSFEANHSTMGGSTGTSKKTAMENLYVCTI